jgi:hypothetical protein
MGRFFDERVIDGALSHHGALSHRIQALLKRRVGAGNSTDYARLAATKKTRPRYQNRR